MDRVIEPDASLEGLDREALLLLSLIREDALRELERLDERSLPPGVFDARHLPGKHDQKTHGHGHGGAETKKWEWRTDEVTMPGTTLGMGPDPVRMRQWTYQRHLVTDFESGFSKEEIEGTILPRLQELQESNPLPDRETIDLRLEKKLESRNPALGETAGLTRLGTGHIAMSGQFADTRVSDDQIPFNTPAAKGRLWSDYVLVHEWGHAIDESGSTARGLFGAGRPGIDYIPNDYGKMSLALFSGNVQGTGPVKAPSEYGKTSAIESHAEAFAEFYLTGGKTPFVAPRIYAEELGWQA